MWDSATTYLTGQVAKYGGSLFQALSDNNNINPTVTATWIKIIGGFSNKGPWTTATAYGVDEVVSYGGNTYISLAPHASTAFDTNLAAGKWEKFNSGIKWRGGWVTATDYLPDDVVHDGTNAWISNAAFTSSASIVTDGIEPAAGYKWGKFVTGAAGVPTISAAVDGRVLSNDGTNAVWKLPAGATIAKYLINS